MDASTPSPTPPATPRGRRFSRRTLLKLAGGAVALGFTAEFVRVVALTNKHTVIPGRVYRTAQLEPDELQEFIAEKGIRTMVNLRGVCSNMPWYIDECCVTHAADVNQEDITFSAKRYPAPDEVRRLIEVFDHTEYPLVLHCQRGADRTGLAATVAILLLTDATLAQARRQLWPRYGHVAVGRTAVLDEFFDYYQTWLAKNGYSHVSDRFRRWVNTEYCPGPYRAELSVIGEGRFAANRGFTVTVRAVNTSVEPWNFTPGGAGGIRLRHTLTDSNGVKLHKGFAGQFARTVNPGEHIDLACGVPPMPPGIYPFHADLFDGQPIEILDADFVQYGSEPLQTIVTVG